MVPMEETRERRARALADRLAATVVARRAAEVEQLDLVAALIDAYDTVTESVLPGRECLVPAGHDGTPLVAEFLPAELGPVLGESVPSAWALVRDVADLRARLPRVWEALHAGAVEVWQARQIARACADLSADAAGWVDARIVTSLGHLPWGRARRRLAGLVMRADEALAARKAESAARERFVRIRHHGDGTSTLIGRLGTDGAVLIDQALAGLVSDAVARGHAESRDILRAEALGRLATPAADAPTRHSPEATLVIHLSAEALAEGHGIARGENDLGPLLLSQLRDLLHHHRIRLQPVIDLAGDPHVDAYEIPDRIADQVRWRDPTEVFPYGSRQARGADLDHTIPYRAGGPPGQTRPSGLGPLGRYTHRAKTHGRWDRRQPCPDTNEWVSPLGYCYRVQRGHTTRITRDELLPVDPTGLVAFHPPPPHLDVRVCLPRGEPAR